MRGLEVKEGRGREAVEKILSEIRTKVDITEV